MQGHRRVDVQARKRLFDDIFKIDEVIVAHELNDGAMSVAQRRLVFERGDSAAVLLFNRDGGRPRSGYPARSTARTRADVCCSWPR